MFKLIVKIFGFVMLSVLLVFTVSFMELAVSGFWNGVFARIFHFDMTAPPMTVKLLVGGAFVGLIFGPLTEEFSKSLFIKKGRSNSWAYSYAIVFALIEGIAYIPLIMNGLGLTLVNAILMRIPALLMHPSTIYFQLNGSSKTHGVIRGTILHSALNLVSGLMFFWTI